MAYQNSVIIGTGSFLPEKIIDNNHFLDYTFYKNDGTISRGSEAFSDLNSCQQTL